VWPKKKVRKRKVGQEFYHHSWRVTEKESEVWNSIIILGGWPKKKVRSGILSSFLEGNPKRKWGQESYHHSWRVTQKESDVRNPIIIIIGGVTEKQSEVRNSIIILGG
jgi:hypothetical protein